ncbi:MAG: hypothetical protein NTW19_11585 [Planctomycetota bacterium]|nr:hypothetical protein [Planctomycetota bacterium]
MTVRRAKWIGLFSAGLLIATLAWPALAEDTGRNKPANRGTGRDDASRGRGLAGEEELNEMVAKLHPTPEQQSTLAARLRAKAGVLSSWDEENKAQMKDLQRKIKDAHDKPAEAAEAAEQLRVLQAGREALAEGQDAQVQAAMPPDMRATWLGPKLGAAAVQRYKANKITPEQETQIKLMCETWIRRTLLAGEAVAARPKVTPPLAKLIETQILTAEQRPRGGGEGKSSGPTTRPASRPAK